MRKYLIILPYTLFLASCSSTQTQGDPEAVKAQYDGVKAQCHRQYNESDRRVAVARAKCIADADKAYSILWRAPDIIYLMNAERIVAAEEWQSGKISKSEYDRQMAQIYSKAVSNDTGRLNSNIAAEAQSQSANASSAAAGAMLMNNMQQQNYYNQRLLNQSTQMYRNPTINTSCNTFGNMTNCTTH